MLNICFEYTIQHYTNTHVETQFYNIIIAEYLEQTASRHKRIPSMQQTMNEMTTFFQRQLYFYYEWTLFVSRVIKLIRNMEYYFRTIQEEEEKDQCDPFPFHAEIRASIRLIVRWASDTLEYFEVIFVTLEDIFSICKWKQQ